ncbi:unnamed protein product [Strongylus vulgaris]|uniref:L-serine deaminase n=1 Tax=Strongylus vulgaris TaxID=40348 RepID=A0A3P7JQM2_STRVU|nr:unnamed protein product [Strongylus vulgaris]
MQVPDIDAILSPCGGGGLLAGCCVAAKALSPKTKVIGLVPETCVSMIKSLEAGRVTTVKTNPTLADGLAVPTVGYNSFHNIKGQLNSYTFVKSATCIRTRFASKIEHVVLITAVLAINFLAE